MKSKLINILFLLFSILSASCMYGCSGEPDPINYGSDICTHCNMKIMDNRFGSVMVNSRNKTFKFDAAECLVDYLKEKTPDFKSLFVTDFNNPGTLIDAKVSFYLISPKRKSPMGENLSAYKTESDAVNSKNSLGGEVFDWTGLYNNLGK